MTSPCPVEKQIFVSTVFFYTNCFQTFVLGRGGVWDSHLSNAKFVRTCPSKCILGLTIHVYGGTGGTGLLCFEYHASILPDTPGFQPVATG